MRALFILHDCKLRANLGYRQSTVLRYDRSYLQSTDELLVHDKTTFTGRSVAAALVVVAVCASGASIAAQRDDSEILDTVVITSPPQALGADVFSVSHLDGEAVTAAANLDVSLSQVPGLSLFRRNNSLSANPTTQGVSLRSIAPSGAGRALVTLDGVPLNDPFGNWVIWSALPPEDVASADVVRGAGAGPYGSGSLTGVIALTERSGNGLAVADLEGGELGQRRGGAAGGFQFGGVRMFASGSAQRSDGWIPVAAEQRGAADDAVTLSASNASLRADVQSSAGTAMAVRVAAYNEHRNSGLVGATSSANGVLASITVAHPEAAAALGWRLQAWFKDSDFSNRSASVSGGRTGTTPANQQYATPAQGWGANAAARGTYSVANQATFSWEAGTDVRFARGESQEYFQYSSGGFLQQRVAGGRTLIGGVYVESALRSHSWLATAGVRADTWRSTDGHLVQRSRSTGAINLEQYPDAKSGVVPTARAGIRREFSNDVYVRGAAYSGFRTPSLNELYRPFRVGNNITMANAALKPERLYGVELGVGGELSAWSWEVTLFKNQLKHAISNVTLGQGPGTFPGAGFVPAGGVLLQRQNAGDIDALGIEAETRLKLSKQFSLRAAMSVVDATVDGGMQAPQLTGLRPTQAPHTTVTAGVVVTPWAPLTGAVNYRYESSRFADDLNTLPLGSASSVDARLEWRITQHFSVYTAANNLLDAAIATTSSADGVVNYAAPRTLLAGFRIGP
jgi:iron complex outermembrane recepter protein